MVRARSELVSKQIETGYLPNVDRRSTPRALAEAGVEASRAVTAARSDRGRYVLSFSGEFASEQQSRR